MNIEQWKDINGWNRYEVSNLGRFRNKKSGRILRLMNLNGYCRVTFCKDGVPQKFMAHRIVAEAFIPNPDNKPFINHIDSSRNNNSIDNLEWCTTQENIHHCINAGRMPRGEQFYNAVLTDAIIREIFSKHSLGYSQYKLAKEYSIGQSHISLILSRKIWKHVEIENKAA